MKMLSRSDCVECKKVLESARERLVYCREKMKGKYGTSDAVRNMKWAIHDINQALSDDPKFEYLNGFKNPPNTPKSRRLGWYESWVV